MNKKLRKIINNYGLKKQLKHFQGEVFELNEAVIKYEESKRNPIDIILNALEPFMAAMKNREQVDNLCDIKDEIADVMVMLKQIQLYYNISTDDIKEIMKQKVERQIKRIEEGKRVSKTEEVNKNEKI